jgi:O-antigen ligase
MFVIAALALVPFAYVETISDVRLHEALFGPHPFSYDGLRRYFGYRPLVLFENGNQYGMYICLAALFAVVGAIDQPRHDRKPWIVVAAVVLAVTALASQSIGAIMLVGAGGGALLAGARVRWLLAFGGAAAALLLAIYSTGMVPVRQIAEQTGVAEPAKALFEATGRRSLAWRANQNDKTAPFLREGLPLGNGQWDWFEPADTRPWGLWSLMAGQYGLVPLGALALMVVAGWLRQPHTRSRRSRAETGETTLRLFRIGTLVVITDAALNSFIFYPLSAIMAACVPLVARPLSGSGAAEDESPAEPTGAQNAATAAGNKQEKSWKPSGTGSPSSPSAG